MAQAHLHKYGQEMHRLTNTHTHTWTKPHTQLKHTHSHTPHPLNSTTYTHTHYHTHTQHTLRPTEQKSEMNKTGLSQLNHIEPKPSAPVNESKPAQRETEIQT